MEVNTLWSLIAENNCKCAIRLLDKLDHIRPEDYDPYHNGSPLHWSASDSYDGNVKLIRLLVERGEDVNSVNDVGNTPLFIACNKGLLRIVRYLVIDCCADILIKNSNSFLPFDIANKHLNNIVNDHICDDISLSFIQKEYCDFMKNSFECCTSLTDPSKTDRVGDMMETETSCVFI